MYFRKEFRFWGHRRQGSSSSEIDLDESIDEDHELVPKCVSAPTSPKLGKRNKSQTDLTLLAAEAQLRRTRSNSDVRRDMRKLSLVQEVASEQEHGSDVDSRDLVMARLGQIEDSDHVDSVTKRPLNKLVADAKVDKPVTMSGKPGITRSVVDWLTTTQQSNKLSPRIGRTEMNAYSPTSF